MGGVLALHVAYRFRRDLKAVFGLSTFLHDESIVFEVIFQPILHYAFLWLALGHETQRKLPCEHFTFH